MTELYDEAWMGKRMLDHRGPDVFDGTTDTNIRKQRFRDAIKACGLACVVIGARKGKPVTWSEAFNGVYGEIL